MNGLITAISNLPKLAIFGIGAVTGVAGAVAGPKVYRAGKNLVSKVCTKKEKPVDSQV